MRLVTITWALLASLLAACGSLDDRGRCGASTDCPAGQYCARTGDGNVCWPDAVPPTVSGVTVACLQPAQDGSSCLRDGVLRVQATIADDTEVLGADVTLDVGGAPVPMVRTGGNAWRADVQLRQLPFGYFEHPVIATVTARDGARNTASLEPGGATTVTRHRFARALDTGVVGLGHPAVMDDGTVAVAGTNGKLYFLPWDGTGVSSVVAVGVGQITAAPLALRSAVWIGSEDNRVYEVNSGASGWQASFRCDTTRPVRGSLAATSSGFVIAASDVGRLYSANASGCAGNSRRGGAFAIGPVIDSDGSVYAASGTWLRRLVVDEFGVPDDDPAFAATTLAWEVFEPLLANSSVYAATRLGAQGRVYRASKGDLNPQQVSTPAAPSGGLVTISDGSILVPEAGGTLSKWSFVSGGTSIWRTAVLNGAPRTPVVLDAAAPFLVSTDVGSVYALRPDGTVDWSGQVSAGTWPLQPGNIYTPPSEPAGRELSIAYFAGSDGVLHAVIVDGKLDGSAPWPKAFHDPQNTNRAGAQP